MQSDIMTLTNPLTLPEWQHLANQRVLLGLSGGMDSMVLLDLLHRSGVHLEAAHVNYGKRGTESDLDQQLVTQKCAELNVALHTHVVEPADWGAGNFQEQAREIRYSFFNRIRAERTLDWLALAHHKDDQTETAVLKIFRAGSNPSVLAMTVVDTIRKIYRPLLAYTRLEIAAYASVHKINWRDDATNEESHYARNLLRNELFPALDTATPGWRNNLQHVLERLETTDELTRHLLGVYENDQQDALPVDVLQKFSEPTRLTILHRFIAGHAPEVSAGVIQQADQLVHAQPGKKVIISPKITLWRDSDKLQLRENTKASLNPEAVRVTTTHVPDQTTLRKPGRLWLDQARATTPLQFRYWQPADKIQPLGLNGHVSLADLLTNRKISSSQKNQAIVAVTFDGKICAVIFPHPDKSGQIGCISHPYRITNKSVSALEITTEPCT